MKLLFELDESSNDYFSGINIQESVAENEPLDSQIDGFVEKSTSAMLVETNENHTLVIERSTADRVRKEFGSVVALVVNRVFDAILVAMDSVTTSRV